MLQRLVLLCSPFDASQLVPVLSAFQPACRVEAVSDLAGLDAALADGAAGTRLLAFCTAVIVPAATLGCLPGPSYNIHPGPPHYPGRHPESWGAYDGVRHFGATLHEMAPRVDEGGIVDVRWFDLPAGAGQLGVGTGAYRACCELVLRWGRLLAGQEAPLPHNGLRWSGIKRRHADLEAMCRIPFDITADELERRRRAFAEVPGSRLTLHVHGLEFIYTTPAPVGEDAPV